MNSREAWRILPSNVETEIFNVVEYLYADMALRTAHAMGKGNSWNYLLDKLMSHHYLFNMMNATNQILVQLKMTRNGSIE